MKQLKQQFVDSWHELRKTKVMAVTPFAGVWIELLLGCQKYSHQISCGVADRCVSNIQGIE